MMWQELQKRKSDGQTIRLGVSGAGWMGSGFLAAVAYVPGMDVRVLADISLEEARRVFSSVKVPSDMVVESGSVNKANDALRKGKYVITDSYSLAAQLEEIDLVVDVTPSPAIGAETAFSCIENGKDVVMVNIEADVTVGRILRRKAEKAGVLYTVSSGDEPGCLMELWDFVNTLGYEPIAIGKGKNNPLNPDATPETVKNSARKAGKDPYQVASYVDGTKTMFEMTCAANATGCVPMKQGMEGPEADLSTVSQVFSLQEDGGIVPFPGVVDFVQGEAMSGGVFITVRIEDERIRDDLQYLKAGKGKYFTFFRPYHLWFLEAPISIARAYLYHQATLQPLDRSVADIMTVAKKDLAPGDRLDTFGGYTFFGVNDHARNIQTSGALPVGLAPGAVLNKEIKKGSPIIWKDVELDERQTVVQLRRAQDAL